MLRPPCRRLLTLCLSVVFSVGLWVAAPPAGAINAPELLPEQFTTVLDLAETLTKVQRENLAQHLEELEAETGWKLRVLTQFDRTPGRAVRDFWNLDEHSVLLVSDARGGNILNFNVGDEAYKILPRTFWVELQTRFGNQYFVRDNGEDQAIVQSLNAVESCLLQGGCRVVPGLPNEQWVLTLVVSMIGGFICGFAGQPRKPGQVFAWKWALVFSPLWGMLFFSFGIGPVVSRTSDMLPLLRNMAGFAGGFLIAFLFPLQGPSSASET